MNTVPIYEEIISNLKKKKTAFEKRAANRGTMAGLSSIKYRRVCQMLTKWECEFEEYKNLKK